MNSGIQLKEMSLAFNNLFKSNKVFAEVQYMLNESKQNNAFSKDTLYTMRAEYQRRINELEKFERELDKFEKFMPSSNFKQLKEALANQRGHLSKMCVSISSFIELENLEIMESLISNFEEQSLIGDALNKELSDFNRDLGFNLFFRAMRNEITLVDLRLMAAAFEPDSELFTNINNIISYIELRDNEKLATYDPTLTNYAEDEQKKDKKEVPVPEVVPEEKTDTQEQTATVSAVSAVQDVQQAPKEPTLQEKLDAIKFKTKGSINQDVQNLTVEDALATIAKDIAILEAKEKLSVSEKFKLSQLKEKQVLFQAYYENIENQEVSKGETKRDAKLAKTIEAISAKQQQIAAAKTQGEQYESKVLRFLSARYQKKLKDQLVTLRFKKGKLTSMQKMSSVARFDKQSKKMARQARIKGTIRQLKTFRDSIVAEINAMESDFQRFSSVKPETVERMRQGNVVMLEQPITLEEATATYEMVA